MTPLQNYHQLVRHNAYQADVLQEQAMACLDKLYIELIINEWHPGLLQRVLGQGLTPVRGAYLWGNTGRGKTWLMDAFYACVDFPQKHRLHFHRFMRNVHAQLNDLHNTTDPLKLVAKQWSEKYRLICLDEFHVSDIGDAMILAGLLDALFKQGVTLVTTSNIPIDDLYKNGLQREGFLPAIRMLKQHTAEVALGTGDDYRMALLAEDDVYHVLSDGQGEENLKKQFQKLSNVPAKTNRDIEINNREFHYRAWANDLIWFDFDELCARPHSANDYLDIAKCFHTVFISGIPRMDEEKDDVAKRFVHLIDALYDNHVKLIATAEVSADQLYCGRLVKFEFDRAVSRLTEMASRDYLTQRHICR